MKSLIVLTIVYALAVAGLMCALHFVPYAQPPEEFLKFYKDNLRGDLFTAFLSLGAFIFALKTFIIVTMKNELYDHPNYKQRVKDNIELGSKDTHYGPLNRLRLFLSWTMLAAISTSIGQISIGLIPHWTTAILCLAASLYAMFLFSSSLVLMWRNLADLLEYWEDGDGSES